MGLTPTGEIMAAAAGAGGGVGAFNVIQLEHAEALVAGAESAGAPVILQISENAVRYHGALEPDPAGDAGRRPVRGGAGRRASRPRHPGRSRARGGGARLRLGDVRRVRPAVCGERRGHPRGHRALPRHGVFVEAELGEVGGKDGVHAPGARTDPAEAVAFVAATGVDALAVAVGTSHAMLEKTAALDLDLIAAHRAVVRCRWCCTGRPACRTQTCTRAVDAGMTKVNIATALNQAFTQAVRDYLAANPDVVDTRKYLAPGRAAVAAEVARLLKVLRAGPATL